MTESFTYSNDWLLEEVQKGKSLKYVFFWGHREKAGIVGKSCFSQWYEAAFEVEGRLYPTAEHWMMAEKARLFDDQEIYQKVFDAASPGAAKALGRKVKGFNAQIWEKCKFEIVVRGNTHKFGQNENLNQFLLNTNNRVLVEASPVDKIWGIGLAVDNPDCENPNLWQGENLLGYALMEARDILAFRANT